MGMAAAVASFALVDLDRLIDKGGLGDLNDILFTGGPESARLVLSTISSAMLTFTGLVFSVTMLVLQLASSQLSPRVMRTFLRDRVNQAVLGLFVATFLYALLVLREVRAPTSGEPFVPAIAISVAFALLLASVGAFVFYIHHMSQAIRATTVLHSVAEETREAIERLYPEGIADEPTAGSSALPNRDPDRVVRLDRAGGVITSVDDHRLLTLARDGGLTIELLYFVGDFVPRGVTLFRIWSRVAASTTGVHDDEFERTVRIGRERTMTQDAAFGFRQIVDIAERALSPGTNDPSTAVQALDELHSLLRELVGRAIPSSIRVDADGSTLLYLPRPTWADYVTLAVDEIRHYGEGSIQVARRLRYLLLDLLQAAPAQRRPPITRELGLLNADVDAAFQPPTEHAAAMQPSASGQGPPTTPQGGPPAPADDQAPA